MTHHRRPAVILARTCLRMSAPHLSQKQKKIQIPSPTYAYLPSSEATWPLICLPLSRRGLSGCGAMPFPHQQPRRTPSLPMPLTYVPITCVAYLRPSHLRRSLLVVYPSPIVVGRVTDPAMAARAHVPWRLRSFPTKPRASMSVASAGAARASRLATESHPNNRNRPAPWFSTKLCN
jgi:hypothetical protein